MFTTRSKEPCNQRIGKTVGLQQGCIAYPDSILCEYGCLYNDVISVLVLEPVRAGVNFPQHFEIQPYFESVTRKVPTLKRDGVI